MPLYSYKCKDCDKKFDVRSSLEEKEKQKGEKFACPKCHSKKLEYQFSATNFIKNIFKGDGGGNSCCCSDDATCSQDNNNCCS